MDKNKNYVSKVTFYSVLGGTVAIALTLIAFNGYRYNKLQDDIDSFLSAVQSATTEEELELAGYRFYANTRPWLIPNESEAGINVGDFFKKVGGAAIGKGWAWGRTSTPQKGYLESSGGRVEYIPDGYFLDTRPRRATIPGEPAQPEYWKDY